MRLAPSTCVVIVVLTTVFSELSFAHRIGDKKWCVMTMTSHLECVYDDSGACGSALKVIKAFIRANNHAPGPILPQASEGTPIDPVCVPNSQADPFYQPDTGAPQFHAPHRPLGDD